MQSRLTELEKKIKRCMRDNRIKKYFDIEELVCKHVFKKHGEYAWEFFDERLLETLLTIREKIGMPIYVNNWQVGGNLTQRGLRCNMCQLVREKSDLEKVRLTMGEICLSGIVSKGTI